MGAALMHEGRHDEVNSRFSLLIRTLLETFNNMLVASSTWQRTRQNTPHHAVPQYAQLRLCYSAILRCPDLILRLLCSVSMTFNCVKASQ